MVWLFFGLLVWPCANTRELPSRHARPSVAEKNGRIAPSDRRVPCAATVKRTGHGRFRSDQALVPSSERSSEPNTQPDGRFKSRRFDPRFHPRSGASIVRPASPRPVGSGADRDPERRTMSDQPDDAPPAAEALIAQVLQFFMADPDRLVRFFDVTGLTPD